MDVRGREGECHGPCLVWNVSEREQLRSTQRCIASLARRWPVTGAVRRESQFGEKARR